MPHPIHAFLFLIGFFTPFAASANPGLITSKDVKSGMLLFKTVTAGKHVPAPLLGTEVDIALSGPVARVRVTQKFLNPSKHWLEGRYLFPLPENAAVNRMTLKSAGREIIAEIRERQAARKIFTTARKQGKRAALIEQHRPNMFTTDVANIGPNRTVTVTLNYLQLVKYDQGHFRLRFPTVVAPRFTPKGVKRLVSPDPAENPGAGHPGTPVAHPDIGKLNPVKIRVALRAGVRLATVTSATHRLSIETMGEGARNVSLADGVFAADRDFELEWRPAKTPKPLMALFREDLADEIYLLAMVLPPSAGNAPEPAPREVIFILDRSGSMGGQSIKQARAAISAALARLRPIDRFNVIRFSDKTDMLFSQSVRASSTDIRHAEAWIATTEAEGGTMMKPAIVSALRGAAPEGMLRQVVFLTDGAVSNESALFDEIAKRLGGARLFTVGIGSAPNSHFMRRAARLGRGGFTHIAAISQVRARIDGLLRKLERPLTTDLKIDWIGLEHSGAVITAYPERLPDLYDGEPLRFTARISNLPAELPDPSCLRLSGLIAGEDWSQTLHIRDAQQGAGPGTLWGRSRIEALETSLHRGADPESVKQAVTATGLRHGIVTRYTSLIAVDKTAARPVDEPLFRKDLLRNLPQGWDFDKVFGKHLKQLDPHRPANGADPGARMHRAALARTVDLPQGATDAELRLMVGFAALLLSGLFLLLRRRA